jgi:hypothetical protein
MIFFSDLLVQKHVFLFLLQARFLGGDLVSQSLPVLNLHTVGFRCFELGLDTSDLCVTLFEVNIVTLSLSASSFKIFSVFLILSLGLLFRSILSRLLCDRWLDTGGADIGVLKIIRLLSDLLLHHFLISLVQRRSCTDATSELWQLPILSVGI